MSPVFLILSGPSCVGKGPLLAALRRCRPDLPFAQPIVHTSREPRPGERDGVEFHFRPAGTIATYDPRRFFVYPMRNQFRAIDLDELTTLLTTAERVILELHPSQVARLRAHPRLAGALRGRLVAVLLQPLAVEEALALAEAAGCPPAEVVRDVMLSKQVHRALRLGQRLDEATVADLRLRAAAAWDELRLSDGFDKVLVNHDAEGSDHWLWTPPIGDAGATLRAVAELLAEG